MFKRQKSSFDTQIEGLTDLYNDTMKKAKDATEVQARKELKAEADHLAADIREIERQKKWNKKTWSIKHPFSRR